MPIEIKELHIKINVTEDDQSPTSSPRQATRKVDGIIEDCIEKMIQMESRKKER